MYEDSVNEIHKTLVMVVKTNSEFSRLFKTIVVTKSMDRHTHTHIVARARFYSQ